METKKETSAQAGPASGLSVIAGFGVCDETRELSERENEMIESGLNKLLTASRQSDPRENPPTGYRYHCIITPYRDKWYDGLGGPVNVECGKIIMREIGDGTAYFFLPNKAVIAPRNP